MLVNFLLKCTFAQEVTSKRDPYQEMDVSITEEGVNSGRAQFR